MANLLPNENKKSIGKTLYGRLFLLLGAVFGVTGALVFLAITPTYIRASSALQTNTAQLHASQEGVTDQEKDERTRLINLRKRTEVLSAVGKKKKLIDTLPEVLGERPQGMTVSTIIYSRKDAEGALTVSGSTPNRQMTQEYVQHLKNTGFFKDVSIPITALTKSEEGSFDIVMKGF